MACSRIFMLALFSILSLLAIRCTTWAFTGGGLVSYSQRRKETVYMVFRGSARFKRIGVSASNTVDFDEETNIQSSNIVNGDSDIINYDTMDGSAESSSVTSTVNSTIDDDLSLNEQNHDAGKSTGKLAATIQTTVETSVSSNESSSKRNMLKFAIPSLGIFLANPLLSNIDNAFVGQTSGSVGLAALSPATICTDQMLYLFSFLSRATTGLVALAYGRNLIQENKHETSQQETAINVGENTIAARDAASAPLTVAIVCGLALTLFYTFFTPRMLSLLNVNPALRKPAASYIYLRGLVASAALAQSVSLSTLLATRDAVTPLRIVAIAAVVNVIGDTLFCAYPFRWGCAGAAAATAIATLVSCGFMLKSLNAKGLLPRLRIPTKKEARGLLEFTGPLLAITLTRLTGFISMQRAAMKLGVLPLAAYQLCINVLLFFLYFAEPISQLSQTKLPALVDQQDEKSVRATLKSVLVLGFGASLAVGALAYSTVRFGSVLFTTDSAVQNLARVCSPAIFVAVATATVSITLDGAMLASREFGFILTTGIASCILQLTLLKRCTSLNQIFGTFAIRLGTYAIAACGRVASGHGRLARALAINKPRKDKAKRPKSAKNSNEEKLN